MDPIVSFKDVHRAFGKNVILNHFNLDIFPGETITVMGGSGTGKSVTLKLLLGLLKPQKGEVYFKGKPLSKMNEFELVDMRHQMGMLFQGAALFDSINVYENIAYPIREHFDFPEEKVASIVSERLALVGLPDIGSMLPSDLSGGMKKRVGLARAIAANPSVILYDEPTTGLDPANTLRICRLILKLQKKLTVTSIVVTHDMNAAFMVSDRIAMLHEKRIEFMGTVEETKRSSNSVVQNFIQGEFDDIGEASIREI